MIKPTYVTPEQAKLLKEKGFDVITEFMYGSQVVPQLEEYNRTRYDIYKDYYYAPEQWQVVEWLRVKHGIHIEVGFDAWNKETYDFSICIKGRKDYHYDDFTQYDSPQEATSAAFDYILKELKLC